MWLLFGIGAGTFTGSRVESILVPSASLQIDLAMQQLASGLAGSPAIRHDVFRFLDAIASFGVQEEDEIIRGSPNLRPSRRLRDARQLAKRSADVTGRAYSRELARGVARQLAPQLVGAACAEGVSALLVRDVLAPDAFELIWKPFRTLVELQEPTGA
jgi:hypothetical protein